MKLLVLVPFCVVMVGGWIANIVQVSNIEVPMSEYSIMIVLKIIGIFLVPLGSVLGFI